MRKIINHIIKGIILIQIFSIAFSCTKATDEPARPGSSNENRDRIVINVKTVYSGYGTTLSSKIREKIKSLRIIVLNGNSVTLNEKKEFDEQVPADEFSYLFTVPYSQSDNRRFYFVANEDQLTASEIGFQPNANVNLPGGITGKSFTEIVNLYPADAENDETDASSPRSNAQDLENILNSIYFRPYYNIIYDTDDQGTVLPTGKIYLPYSVYYPESGVTKKDEAFDEQGNLAGYSATMNLVPVATKFEFCFRNYRINPVELSDLKITQFDNLDFLFAKVGKDDLFRSFDSEKLYWADWLAKVAEDSWNNIETSDQNNTFNTKYGWISQYTMPDATSPNVMQFPPYVSPSVLTILPMELDENGEEIPGVLYLGPYYLPESKNMVDGKHWYGLYFKVRDTKNKTEFVFANDAEGNPMQIENIGALFRNTHVIINVDMGEGEPVVEGVYAELMPFKTKEAWGYVGGYFK